MNARLIVLVSMFAACCFAAIDTDKCPGKNGNVIPSPGWCNARRKHQLALGKNMKENKSYWVPECTGSEDGSEYKRIQKRPNSLFVQFCVEPDTGCEIFWNAPQPARGEIFCDCMIEQFSVKNPTYPFHAQIGAVDPACDAKTGQYTKPRYQNPGIRSPPGCIGPQGEVMKQNQKNGKKYPSSPADCFDFQFCPKGVAKC